jgi:hypothetical protein
VAFILHVLRTLRTVFKLSTPTHHKNDVPSLPISRPLPLLLAQPMTTIPAHLASPAISPTNCLITFYPSNDCHCRSPHEIYLGAYIFHVGRSHSIPPTKHHFNTLALIPDLAIHPILTHNSACVSTKEYEHTYTNVLTYTGRHTSCTPAMMSSRCDSNLFDILIHGQNAIPRVFIL